MQDLIAKLDTRGTPYALCGDALLIHGDCLEVLPLIEAGSVDMIWTDPPYGHNNLEGDLQSARIRDGVKGARVAAAEPIANDGADDMRFVVDAMLLDAAIVLNRDCCCCCCCCGGGGGRRPTFAWTAERMDRSGLEFFHATVWDKSARGNGMGWRYRRNYEFVMIAHRKGGKLLWADNDTAVPNIVRHMPVVDRMHPNEKPADMIEDFVCWHTKLGQLVLDPFAGSFTTAVACLRTCRKFIGIEREKKYFDIGVERVTKELKRCELFEPVPQIVQSELFK